VTLPARFASSLVRLSAKRGVGIGTAEKRWRGRHGSLTAANTEENTVFLHPRPVVAKAGRD
jgi:hypothetical protein